ncbi:MAG: hypothetical protein ACI8R0_001735, partial [Alteromonadales bacterium]
KVRKPPAHRQEVSPWKTRNAVPFLKGAYLFGFYCCYAVAHFIASSEPTLTILV